MTAGDRPVAPLGLTSARWQILGAIVAADRPQPVAWLARNLGANRQNVQRIVNDLHKEGLIGFEANPHHRRAHHVVLSDKGRETFDAAMRLQAPWINSLSDGLLVKDIETVHRVVAALRRKLEGNDEAASLRVERQPKRSGQPNPRLPTHSCPAVGSKRYQPTHEGH